MGQVKICCYSEGVGDIGRDGLGPLPVLVQRLLGSPAYLQCEGDRFPRVHDDRDRTSVGLVRKARLAVETAARLGYQGAAIVIDRDGRTKGGRRKKLQAGRDEANSRGGSVPAAVGLAVEMFEAWLLADEQALTKALSLDDPMPAGPSPESLRNPKKDLDTILDRCPDAVGVTPVERMTSVAARIELNRLRTRCPTGFAPFADEVAEYLQPLVGRSSE